MQGVVEASKKCRVARSETSPPFGIVDHTPVPGAVSNSPSPQGQVGTSDSVRRAPFGLPPEMPSVFGHSLSGHAPASQRPLSDEKDYAFDELEDASTLKRQDNGIYELLTGLSWIADGVNEGELDTVATLIDFGIYEPVMAVDFIEMSWFRDGITKQEAWAFDAVAYYDSFAPDRLRELPWVRDGIDSREAWALVGLAAVFAQAPGPADRLASQEWFRDGINRDESDVLKTLGAMSLETKSTNSIIWMPFLESIEETDALALRALYNLLMDEDDASVGSYAILYANPVISGGIADEETVRVALAADAYAVNPDLADTLLDPSDTTLETRTIDLPLAGEVVLKIMRMEEGSPKSMDSLAKSVEFAEDYMGEPFPVNTVLLLFADAVKPGFLGHYSGSNITIHPDFDGEDSENIIMHEVAHHYWHGSAHDWVDEGAAEFLSVRYLEAEMGFDAGELLDGGFHYEDYCDGIDTLSDLEGLIGDGQAHTCAYELGLLFFLELRETVGATEFQRGFQDLYLSGNSFFEVDDAHLRNISHVLRAFEFNSEATRVVIPKWYGGK